MSLLTIQNFYKETVTTAVAAGAVNMYVSTLPTPATGYLVISPSSESLREIVFYTAKGTDGGGDYVTLTAPNRGLGGTTDQTHAVAEPVRMNFTAEHQLEISNAIDALSASGSPDSSTTTKGVGKLSASPNVTLGTVTVTIASPGVFTYTTHNLLAGDTIELTTTGTLPTGLVASTTYFVISAGLTANDFQVSTSLAGAAVDTSGSQSGVHTLIQTTPVFVGDNDTRIPDADTTAALAGTSGTPSVSNKFVTNDDTSSTGESGKVVRPSGITLPAALIGHTKKVYTSGSTTEIANNTTTETNIFQQSIAANFLSTDNAVKFKVLVSDISMGASGCDPIFRLKYGTTTLVTLTPSAVNGASSPFSGILEGALVANASASSQTGTLFADFMINQTDYDLDLGTATSTLFYRDFDNGTATEDSTGALNLTLTIQWTTATVGSNFTPSGIIIELVS
jgi:hypothetical protein